MKIILVSKNSGATRSFNINLWSCAFVSVCLACIIGVPVGTYYAFFDHNKTDSTGLLSPELTQQWQKALKHQSDDLEQARQLAQHKLSAMALRIAELQARLVRIDALGERLTTIAKIEKGEFDFSRPPAVGGPELQANQPEFAEPEIASTIDELAEQISDRQHQLEILESLLANRKIQNDVFIAGRPVKKGWISSRYGRRTDPFSGNIAWHGGVDFAGKDGSDIVSVAAGVVTWSSDKYGYGNLVEINHGNGFVTRYAHCKENLVKVGDVVKKGQIVALMGSSGRSTGPHVHFEVFKNGRAVDPATYIHRASR